MERTSRGKIILFAIVVAILACGPLFLLASEMQTITRVLILGLWALSLNLLLGNTGIVSFAHGIFYGVGAYAVALTWLHLGISPLWGIVLGPFAGAVLSAVAAPICFRAQRLYFALLTLAISQVCYVIVVRSDLTQGYDGVFGVELPSWLESASAKYLFILGVTTIAFLGLRMVVGSPFGSMLRGIRDERERANALGINVVRYEMAAFVIAGAFAGLAGSLYVVSAQNAYPEMFQWTSSAEPLLTVLIGGMATFAGPFLGALVVVGIQDNLRDVTDNVNLFYGLVVLFVALVFPKGILGTSEVVWSRLARRSGSRVDESSVDDPPDPERIDSPDLKRIDSAGPFAQQEVHDRD